MMVHSSWDANGRVDAYRLNSLVFVVRWSRLWFVLDYSPTDWRKEFVIFNIGPFISGRKYKKFWGLKSLNVGVKDMKYRNPGPPMRTPKEDPAFEIPDRHTGYKGPGTDASGAVMTNQVYRQPWVEHDGVLDHDGTRHDG